MKNMNNLTQAKYGEWLASLFGACLIAFVLGVWLANTFSAWAWLILIVGVLLHSYGMYKTYQRNK